MCINALLWFYISPLECSFTRSIKRWFKNLYDTRGRGHLAVLSCLWVGCFKENWKMISIPPPCSASLADYSTGMSGLGKEWLLIPVSNLFLIYIVSFNFNIAVIFNAPYSNLILYCMNHWRMLKQKNMPRLNHIKKWNSCIKEENKRNVQVKQNMNILMSRISCWSIRPWGEKHRKTELKTAKSRMLSVFFVFFKNHITKT